MVACDLQCVWFFFIFVGCMGREYNAVSVGKDLGPSTALTCQKKSVPLSWAKAEIFRPGSNLAH